MTLSPRSFKTATLAALIIAGGITNPAHLQAESLLEIYSKAVNNDPSIREAQANMYATMESKPQARADLLPQLDFSGQWQTRKQDGTNVVPILGTPTDQSSKSDENATNWSFNLTQTLFRWDQFARMGRADKEVSQAQLDYGFAQQELMVRVTEAYFNVLAARDTLVSEQAAKAAIERQLEQANRRYEVGLIAITDVQEARAGFDEAIAGEIVAKRDLANSREALREITGEYNEVLSKPAKEIPLVVPEPAIQDEWVAIAQAQNLALLSAKIGADITRSDVSAAKSGYMPTLDLQASYGNNSADGTSEQTPATRPTTRTERDITQQSVGIQLNIPIFSGGGTSSKVKEAVYRHRASKENFEKVVRQTERETRDAYYGVESEISRVKALRQSRKSSEVALEATEAGYEVGTRTTVDVLDARRSLFLAQTNYARSRYDYIVNVIKLKQAAGTLNPDDLAMVNSWLQRESDVLDINPASSESDAE